MAYVIRMSKEKTKVIEIPKIKYQNEFVIETPDNKLWIYDNKHCVWIDVTMPEKFKKLRKVKLK